MLPFEWQGVQEEVCRCGGGTPAIASRVAAAKGGACVRHRSRGFGAARTEDSRQQQQLEVPAAQGGGKGESSGKGGRGRVNDGGSQSNGEGVRSLSPPPPGGSGRRGRSSETRGEKESSASRRPSTASGTGGAGTPSGRPKFDLTINHMQDDLNDCGSIGRGDWHDVEKRITLLITDDHRQKVHCGSP
eukprot:GHVU01026153.1.p2 GENE.GHVU01026153.1~~GHVU01026153.1.p2  ORF type:complete len:188 (+),score=31.63 GHVU01026153.1:1086-1649(+)